MKTLVAWDRADFQALSDLAPEIGARVDEKSARAIDARLDELKRALKKPTVEARRIVVEALANALASADGFGFSASQGNRCIICLAVRQGSSVLLDVGATSGLPRTPASAWPELAPWKRAVHENLDPVRRWARKRERIELPAVAPSRVESTGPALAELDELEAAAIAAPDADEPRAVLADALLSRGDPRGELVALQLRSAPYLVPSTAHRALLVREERLVAAHRAEWTPKSLAYARAATFRRGLIEAITVSGSVFQKHGADMIASAPLQSLRLAPYSPKTLEALLETSAVCAIRHLDLREAGGERIDVEKLAKSPHLASLQFLELGYGARLGAAEIALLGSSTFAASLIGLRANVTEDGARALSPSRDALPSLRRLAVFATAPGHVDLFSSRGFEALDVGTCPIPLDEALPPPARERLVFLAVSRDGRNVSAIGELASVGAPPPRLAALSLSSASRLSAHELAIFLGSPVFARVRYLKASLDLEPLDEAQAKLILAHPSLAHLTMTEGALDLLSESTRARLAARGHYTEKWARPDAFDRAFVAPHPVLEAESLRDDGPIEIVEAEPPKALVPATDLERASDPHATPEALAALARGASEEVVLALVANPAAPPNVLEELSPPSATARILVKVAQHPNASAAILERLAGSKHKSVRAAAAGHPRASAAALSAAFEGGTIHEAMVSHANAPDAVLRAAVASGELGLVEAAARAPRLPDDVRAVLFASDRPEVVASTLERAETSLPELEAALDRHPTSPVILCAVAMHPTCSAALLHRIARVASDPPSDNVLYRVAAAAAAPAAALELCAAESSDERVLSAVARHPHASSERIAALAETRPHDVARNPSASPALLAALVAASPVTYRSVAANPACPVDLHRAALAHPEKEVRRAAASNPRLDPVVLADLARHPDEHVRSGVAENPRTPLPCLRALALNPSPRVWLSLARSPSTPRDVRETLANGPAASVPAVASALAKV